MHPSLTSFNFALTSFNFVLTYTYIVCSSKFLVFTCYHFTVNQLRLSVVRSVCTFFSALALLLLGIV